jgi:uncharacterized protein (DUF1778 family)
MSGAYATLEQFTEVTMATTTRSEKLDLRLTPDAKRTLQTAAAAANRSVSDFVLESALERVAETLPDRIRFRLGQEKWAEFQTLLDAEPRSNPRLADLLRRPGFFDSSST